MTLTRVYLLARFFAIYMLPLMVYFLAGWATSDLLPLVQLPDWAVNVLSFCFEGPFVILFGQW